MSPSPRYQVMPPLSDADFAALKSDIEARGVMVPIDYDEAGEILDGHYRVQACHELGITDWPKLIREGLTEDEKRTHARMLNLARRHLDQAQRRALIADQLRETPGWSNRQIAQALGVDHKTVEPVRIELESNGEIPNNVERVEASGRKARGRKPRLTKIKLVDNSPAGKAGAKERAKEIRVEEHSEQEAANANLAKQPVILPDGIFGTIIIDPPWDMEKIEREVRPNQVAFDYPRMSEEQLIAYGEIVNSRAADECHLFMWTTHRFLPMALRLIEAWDFRYVLTFTWHKSGGFQPYGLPQYNSEFAVYARRGAPSFIETTAFNTCFSAPRREHSRKPDEFYETIRRVTAEGRCDWFSRGDHPGFVPIGNETGKFGEVAA